jgi:hypothetical protein
MVQLLTLQILLLFFDFVNSLIFPTASHTANRGREARKREITALKAAMQETPVKEALLITLHEEDVVQIEGLTYARLEISCFFLKAWHFQTNKNSKSELF